jgi:hypothetical protein
MQIHEVIEKMKKGKIGTYKEDRLRLLTIQTTWNSSPVQEGYKLQIKQNEEWQDLPALNSSAVLSDQWGIE